MVKQIRNVSTARNAYFKDIQHQNFRPAYFNLPYGDEFYANPLKSSSDLFLFLRDLSGSHLGRDLAMTEDFIII
jgi:hypothetical protein